MFLLLLMLFVLLLTSMLIIVIALTVLSTLLVFTISIILMPPFSTATMTVSPVLAFFLLLSRLRVLPLFIMFTSLRYRSIKVINNDQMVDLVEAVICRQRFRRQ
mmetsp:Transcript_35157/g.53889  ORF Transcript_35157/g.53889 Transcript_35157/m.53889 type:complete len:104 (-) Transcript_35157:33-344(-)